MGALLSSFHGSWRRRTAGALAAGLFIAYLITLPTHLVHHLFDEEQGRTVCPHLAQSQQTPELQIDPPGLLPPLATQILATPVLEGSRSTFDLSISHSRAPPRSQSSA